MKLIFGLGNPGEKYDGTRHNIGFSILDILANKVSITFDQTKLYSSAIFTHNSEEICIIKPLTYMNLSGYAVRYFFEKYPELQTNDILIVYDDIHLPVGKIRFRGKGSDGGHNGIKHITEILSSAHYPRLRFGVDLPKADLIEHVLGPFHPEEQTILTPTIDASIEGVFHWIEHGLEKTMNVFNSKDFRPSPPENTTNE